MKNQKELELTIKEMRNERSQELFDLPESELNLEELILLDKYIYDISNPKWKPIYVNNEISPYEISNTGLIRNIKTGKIRKGVPDKQNYLRLNLSIKGKEYPKKIHRLVAEAFIPNPENKPTVNHIYPKHYHKKIKCNWVGNLEWNTYKENVNHSIENGLDLNRATGERVGTSVYTEKQIRKVCELLRDPYKQYKSISNDTGVSYDVIAKIATGELWYDISKEYNIPKRIVIKNNTYTDDKIHEVCKLLVKGVKPIMINKLTNVPFPIISSIKHHKRYTRITSQYDF